MMRSAFLAAALGLAIGGPAFAASAGGTTTLPLLHLEQGVRGIGMGGAQVAVTDEGGALFWNPAGLSQARFREVSLSYAMLYENMNSQFGSVVWPVSREIGTLGASFSYLAIPGIDSATLDPAGNLVTGGAITANNYSASLAYSRLLGEDLSIGGNFKIVGEKLAAYGGTGFAFDGGLQYRHGPVGAGVAVQNWGPNLVIAGTGTPLPLDVRAGISYAPISRLMFAADEEKPRDGDYRLHLGAEWKLNTAFTVRGGFAQSPNLGSGAGYTAGLGYMTALGTSNGWAGEETPWWEKKMDDADRAARPEGSYIVFFDYAFVANGDLGQTHRLTLGCRF